MIDDPALALDGDAELRRRWEVIRRKLEANSESLLSQGGLIYKTTSSGRRAWAVRWVERSGDRPVHHALYLGDDERLVALARRHLGYFRMLGDLPEEVAGHARFAATASYALRRLAARPRGAKG